MCLGGGVVGIKCLYIFSLFPRNSKEGEYQEISFDLMNRVQVWMQK